MNYQSYFHQHRLAELGLSSPDEAAELEFELDLRFEDFTRADRRTWLKQNSYLEHFSQVGTVTHAARGAAVTVYTAQRWKFDDVLGFNRRFEIAELEFKDGLKEMALRRADEPNAPASLLIELLRSYIPEEFSRNDHNRDSSKSEELIRHYHENARREIEAGYPTLERIAQGDPDPFHNGNRARYAGPLPTVQDSQTTDFYPARQDFYTHEPSPTREDTHTTDLSPTGGEPPNPNLSPGGGDNQRGGTSHDPSPIGEDSQTTDLPPTGDEPPNPNLPPAGDETPYPDLSPAGDETPYPDLSPAGDETPYPDLSPAGDETPYPDLSPAGDETPYPDLSPAGGETQRGGPTAANDSDSRERR